MAKKTRNSPQDAPQIIIAEEMQPEEILVSYEAGIITSSDIQRSINEYLERLHDPNDIYCNKPMLFNGLLEYIYKRNIKSILPNTYNNDYELLDDIFRYIYLYLCYMFNYVPNISTFCNHLVHIDISNCYNISNGFYRKDGSRVNNNTYSIYKNWQQLCDGDLFEHIAQTGSVGGIFVAKVKGYSDQPQTMASISIALTPRIDEKQLVGIASGSLPELPDNMP